MPNLSELQFPCHSNKDYKLTPTNVWLELKKMTALIRHVPLYVNKYSTKVGSFLPATGEQFSFFSGALAATVTVVSPWNLTGASFT